MLSCLLEVLQSDCQSGKSLKCGRWSAGISMSGGLAGLQQSLASAGLQGSSALALSQQMMSQQMSQQLMSQQMQMSQQMLSQQMSQQMLSQQQMSQQMLSQQQMSQQMLSQQLLSRSSPRGQHMMHLAGNLARHSPQPAQSFQGIGTGAGLLLLKITPTGFRAWT